MSFELGTAVDLQDLLAKLNTFATATHGGWTAGYAPNPNTTNGWMELHKGSLSVSWKFPVGAQAPPLHMSCHQATAFINAATAPGAHTQDSGNGYNAGTTGHTNANLLAERCVRDIGDGPFVSYYFFADDTPPNDYIHVVCEPVPGMFRHFGFGSLVKFGDNWTGGEYVYGHYHDTSATATATDQNHQTLLDGLGATSDRVRAATVHANGAGLLNIGTAIWGVSAQVASANLLNDTAGLPRRQIHGTFRAGMEPRGFGNPIGNFSSGVIPGYSIAAYYRDPSNPRVQLLGNMPDVSGLNVRNFDPGKPVTVGTDTWRVFPMSIKTTANVANRSLFSGIAYKEVL